jgi:hypothetical protein
MLNSNFIGSLSNILKAIKRQLEIESWRRTKLEMVQGLWGFERTVSVRDLVGDLEKE